MSVSIEWREAGPVVVIDLAGQASIMDGTILQQTVRGLTKEGKRLFIFNLAGLRHMDSFGLGQLVATYISVRDLKGDAKIVNPMPTVREMLRYTRIDTVVQICSSEAEAVALLQRVASA